MIPIDFTVLIQAITGIVNPTAMLRNKLERNETVIRLLKQFNLSPDSPPADFSGVYAYTLIEYGVGKPKAVLELFRQPEIRQALQAAWGQDNFSILLQVGEGFLEGAALGDELRALGVDVRQEFYQFATVFIAIAKRTRTPADILTTQQLNSLHRQIAQVQDRLERLPTIEGIRTEMARLTAQPFLALPEGSVVEQCRAFALAQQMRGWFETLDYRFEPYEQWQADGFEWIINIPVRRGRYDRILVRGIEGEAELRDVMALRQSVEAQQTDEGWLVTSRRISRAARDEVEKPENRHLDCYTFDELVDLDADFTGYVEWLDAEIKRRKIDTRYVPLGCTKEEIDPDTQQRLGVSRYDERDGWIDGYLDRWLDDPAKEHISVLGEFGTGKTWVAFHYAWTALQRYQEAKERGVQRPRLPLVITLRDYAKALNVENVLAGFFFTQHNIRLNSEVFDQLNRMGKLLLIFDGFDEMAAKVDKQQMINNFWELAKVVVPGAKVILTCRTEHFPDAREGRALLNAQLQASTSNLTGETPQFEVLELEKFNDDQIRQVMSFQASAQTVEQVISNSQLLDLARRPVMTELILEALPDIEAGKPVDMSRVYLYAVRRKMERDIKAERTFTSLADKLYFLCELSWEMLSSDRMSLNYREFPDRIRRLFGSAVQEEKDLDHWHYDMMGQTMLIRNADGDYTPAHRSLLEFFVAYKFAAELGALADDFAELLHLLHSALDGNVPHQPFTWSTYCQTRITESEKASVLVSRNLVAEPLKNLRSTFGSRPLSKALTDLLLPMISAKQPLLHVVDATRGENLESVRYVGGNVVNLLLKMDRSALENRDLSHAIVLGADFSGASLHHTNFYQANLTDCLFTSISGRVYSSAFSPDAKYLVSGDFHGAIHLWSVESSKKLMSFLGHESSIQSIVFDTLGKRLLSGSHDATVKLWSTETGECLRTFQGHTDRVNSICISPNQHVFASASHDQTIKLWDLESGVCMKTLQGHTSTVYSVAFHPSNNQILISGSNDNTLKIWDVNTGECLKTLSGHTNRVDTVAVSADGIYVASSGRDQTIKIWNLQSGECLMTLRGHTEFVNSVTFSPVSSLLASVSHDQSLKLWSLADGECVATLTGHTDRVYSVSFSSQGHILATGSRDQTVRFWSTTSKECLKVLQGYANWVGSVAFSPDGLSIASGNEDRTIRIWNLQEGKCTKILRGHTDWVGSVVFSPDGQRLASSSGDKSARIWDVETGECIHVLQEHTNRIHAIAYSDDGTMIATAGADSSIWLWNAISGKCIMKLEGHTKRVVSVAFNPKTQILASGSGDSTAKLWDLKTGRCLSTLEGHLNWVHSVRFSPNGLTLATSGDSTIRLWDVETGSCRDILKGHSQWIGSVAFSPDGQKLVSGSGDTSIRLWDIDTGKCTRILEGHTDWIWSVTFDPSGQRIASGSGDDSVRIWSVETNECLQILRNDRPYEGMNITEITGVSRVDRESLKRLGAIEHS